MLFCFLLGSPLELKSLMLRDCIKRDILLGSKNHYFKSGTSYRTNYHTEDVVINSL
jgi:hypothetical protein